MKPFRIAILEEAPAYRIRPEKFRELLGKVLRILGWKKAGLSVLLTDDKVIRRINRRHLGHDRPTDVISFSQIEGPSLKSAPGARPCLGDIVLSLETAERQAGIYGNTPDYETAFYLCHGILHLMGRRDDKPSRARAMEREQIRILKRAGISRDALIGFARRRKKTRPARKRGGS